MKIEKLKYKNLKYYICCQNETENQPIIIHIHGAGSRGEDLDKAIKANPIANFMSENNDFPFKVYAPQCFANTWFDIFEQLIDFIKYVKVENSNSTIYLTGISMGGYCSWQLLQTLPDFFKKAIICCGGGMYWNAGRIITPVRAFHGKLDKTVFCEESIKMRDAINNCKHTTCDLTIFDELSHNCWDAVFSNKENYEWFLDKKIDDKSGETC